MSVTITLGGVTITGAGVSFSAPPSGGIGVTAGWYMGGNRGPQQSLVQRITYANDTATSSVRGPLSSTAYNFAGAGTTSAGWTAGNRSTSAPFTAQSLIQRITYSTDTATASVRGSLSRSIYGCVAVSDNTTYGWWTSGVWDSPSNTNSQVDRVTYTNDTATASIRGPLLMGHFFMSATSTTEYGWIAGGNTSGTVFGSGSIVQRITYASDTATAIERGPLAATAYTRASSGNSSYGYYALGPGAKTTINRVTYATDTATASVRGPLSIARLQSFAATGNESYGWYAGGTSPAAPGPVSTVDKIDYAVDTATATQRGPLSSLQVTQTSTSGNQ